MWGWPMKRMILISRSGLPKIKAEFEEQMKEETQLNALIAENLVKVKP